MEETVELIGITVPTTTATIGSVQRGRIAKVTAAEGSWVNAGDIVFTLADDVQRARVEFAQAAAESTLEVDLARARWKRAKHELDRLVTLYGDNSASSKELADTVAEEEVRRIDYKLARFAHEQAMRAYERERRRLDEFHVRAPFTGYVSEHLRHPGETVDETDGVVVLAQLDPLQVEVDCPVALAGSIRVGDQLEACPLDRQWARRTATVVFANRVVDGASQTFRLKLSVDNADAAWMAGLKVRVIISLRDADGLTAKNELSRAVNR